MCVCASRQSIPELPKRCCSVVSALQIAISSSKEKIVLTGSICNSFDYQTGVQSVTVTVIVFKSAVQQWPKPKASNGHPLWCLARGDLTNVQTQIASIHGTVRLMGQKRCPQWQQVRYITNFKYGCMWPCAKLPLYGHLMGTTCDNVICTTHLMMHWHFVIDSVVTIYRNPLYLMAKTMVSCRFSLQPIHWHLGYPEKKPNGQVSSLPVAPSCNEHRGFLIGVTRGHEAHVQNHQHAHQQDHVQEIAHLGQQKHNGKTPKKGVFWGKKVLKEIQATAATETITNQDRQCFVTKNNILFFDQDAYQVSNPDL